MLQRSLEVLLEQPLLSLLWLFVTWITCGFIFTLEVLATIWVIAELRTRLFKLKQQRIRLPGGNVGQTPINRNRTRTNSQRHLQQRMMRYRRPDNELDDWIE